MQILVSDAQYVYRGDPLLHMPNPNTGQAYFEGEAQTFFGRSHTDLPFNRSCPVHLTPPVNEGEQEMQRQSKKKNRIFSPHVA
jgi:hypothetical protein